MPNPPAPKSRSLTLKQRRFVQALPTASSQTQAAIIAGYSSKGNTPAQKASETVRKGYVQEALAIQEKAAANAAIANLVERKSWLSKVLRNVNADEPQPVQAGLAASDQLNRIERVYSEPAPTGDTYNTQMFVGYSAEELRAIVAAMKAKELPDATS